MAKKITIAVALLGLVLFFSSGYLFRPSDETQIRESLRDALVAAHEGKPSPVLDNLSFDFSYGGQEVSRMDIAKVVRQAKPQLSALNEIPEISGDTAKIVTSIAAKFDYMGFAMDTVVDDVTVTFQREVGTKWLIVPQPKWRIVSVDAPNLPNK